MGRKQRDIVVISKRLGAMVGCAAVALMGALCICWNDSAAHHPGGIDAGSGAGSTAGVYTQPSAAGMNVGPTDTWTTPATTPAIARAQPVVRARG
jgi:hypothetical protein